MSIYYRIKKCRICGNKDLKSIIDLKEQYIQGSFIKEILQNLIKRKFL